MRKWGRLVFLSLFMVIQLSTLCYAESPSGNAGTSVPVSPGDASGTAVIDQMCPAFSWSLVNGAVSYRVEVYEQVTADLLPYESMSAIAKPVSVHEIAAPALSWTPSSGECLNRGIKYAWYVRGVDQHGDGKWSEPRVFQVEAMTFSIEQKEAIQEIVKAYLNGGGVAATAASINDAAVMRPSTFSSNLKAGVRKRQGTSQTSTLAPNIAPLSTAVEINNNSMHWPGGIRLGNETGTFNLPDYPDTNGMIIRRAVTTEITTGNVVARTDHLTLQRNGFNGGFRLVSDSGASANNSIACMGTDGTSSVNFYSGIGAGATIQVYTNSQNVVFFTCSFGDAFDDQHVTQVTLQRTAGDWVWVGNIISSYNQ